MGHEMIVHLTDDEYAALEMEAEETGISLEFLFHEVLAKHIRASKKAQHLWTQQEKQAGPFRPTSTNLCQRRRQIARYCQSGGFRGGKS